MIVYSEQHAKTATLYMGAILTASIIISLAIFFVGASFHLLTPPDEVLLPPGPPIAPSYAPLSGGVSYSDPYENKYDGHGTKYFMEE